MAHAYGVLVVIAIALCVPLFLMLDSLLAVLVLVPAALLGRSALIALSGGWRNQRQLELATVSAVTGMLLIPVMLVVVLVIAALRRW